MKDKISILAIETSSKLCSVALGIDGILISEYTVYKENSQDKELAELSRKIVFDNGLSFADLSAIAISAGPGSFTGLRIGAGFAKGLCFDGKTKLIAIPTLLALVSSLKSIRDISGYREVWGVIHSHKDLFYAQKFDNMLNPISEPSLITESEIHSQETDDSLLVINYLGDNANIFGNYQINSLKSNVLIGLGFDYYNESIFVDADSFIPLYYQDFTVKTKNNII